jgi:hypothetical protein
MLIHHVVFWLKPELKEEEIRQFEIGVKSLETIREHLVSAHVGKPAGTRRPVIDSTYSYVLMLVFENLAAHDAYQNHPVHVKFVADCSRYWEKVLIYDSESI